MKINRLSLFGPLNNIPVIINQVKKNKKHDVPRIATSEKATSQTYTTPFLYSDNVENRYDLIFQLEETERDFKTKDNSFSDVNDFYQNGGMFSASGPAVILDKDTNKYKYFNGIIRTKYIPSEDGEITKNDALSVREYAKFNDKGRLAFIIYADDKKIRIDKIQMHPHRVNAIINTRETKYINGREGQYLDKELIKKYVLDSKFDKQ